MRIRLAFATTLLLCGVVSLLIAFSSGSSLRDASARGLDGATLQTKLHEAAAKKVDGYVRKARSGRPGAVRVRGWITPLHIDTPKGSGRWEYTLHTSENRSYAVDLDEVRLRGVEPRSEDPRIDSGTIVEGTGTLRGDTIALATGNSAGNLPKYALPPSQTPPANSQRTVLIVPINFTNDASQPVDSADVAAQFNGLASGTVNSYYRESSYNRLGFTAESVGWTTTTLASTCLAQNLRAAARNAAIAKGKNPDSYDHIVAVFPAPATPCNAAGDQGAKTTFIPVSPSTLPAVGTLIHEIGHNLGLDHSNALACTDQGRRVPLGRDCQSYEYEDVSDSMGYWTDHLLTGFHRAAIGALPLENTRAVDPTVNESYTLRDLNDGTQPAKTTQLLQIPRAGAIAKGRTAASYLYVDYRQPLTGSAFDTFDPLDPLVRGVVVRMGAGYLDGPDQASLLPTVSREDYFGNGSQRYATNLRSRYPVSQVAGAPTLRDSVLRPKQSLYDPDENVTITNVQSSGGTAQVRVHPGAPRVGATTAGVVNGKLTVRAASGVVNGVIVSVAGASLLVTDTSAAVTPGAGCSVNNPITVTCPLSGITGLDIDASDLDDSVTLMPGVSTPATIVGGTGADAIEGGDGADVIDAGTGADIVEGNGGADTISYAVRTAKITFVTGPGADKGELGEYDRVADDVENVIGGSGDDVITLTSSVDHVIDGGDGFDDLTGGPQGDQILTRDGKIENIDCGAGSGVNTAKLDNNEVGTNCTANRVGQAEITNAPAEGGAVGTAAPQFWFAERGGLSLQCKIENGTSSTSSGFSTCTSPWTAPSQTNGWKTFTVRAVDSSSVPVGNPVTRTFEIDTVYPDTTLSSSPPSTSGTSATFVPQAGAAGSKFLCALDSTTLVPCTSPMTYDGLSSGSHTFRVRAMSRAGLGDLTPVSYTWTVDGTAPDTSATGPAGGPADTTPDFALSGTPAGDVAGYECRIAETGKLAEVAFVACSGSTTHTSAALDDGSYEFEVRARDALGNRDPVPFKIPFSIVGSSPTATLTTINGQPTATITGGASRKDTIEIWNYGPNVVVYDGDATIVPTAPCTAVSDGGVACNGVSRVVVNGGSRNDEIKVATGAIPITFNGGDGDDLLSGSTAADIFNGGTGTDTVSYADRTAAVTASIDGSANDGVSGEGDTIATDVESLTGGTGGDTLTGGATAGVLRGGDGNDTLQAGTGGATLDGGLGSDAMNGGTGIDTVDYSARTTPVRITLNTTARSGAQSDNTEDDRISSAVEHARGSSTPKRSYDEAGASPLRDEFTDNALNNTFWSNDVGSTAKFTGGGNDVLQGGSGVDYVTDGPGTDTYNGGGGDDRFTSGTTNEADTYNGGGGSDEVAYNVKTAAVSASLVTRTGGTAGENDVYGTDIEGLYGSPYNDTLTGNAEDNLLDGKEGDDIIDPGLGSDSVNGGVGNDVVTYASRTAALRFEPLVSATGTKWVTGGQGAERDRLVAARTILGSGDDYFVGNASAPGAEGGPGNDTLVGGDEANRFVGGSGTDTLQGNGGDDTLLASDGENDIVDCGTGYDAAASNAGDTVTDCEPAAAQFGTPTAPPATPAQVNLTTDPVLGASLDWIHWSGITNTLFERKAGVAAGSQISTWTKIGAFTVAMTNGSATYAWSDAATAPAAATSIAGPNTGGGTDRGFKISVPASPATRTLKLHIGIVGATNARLRASLASAPGVYVASTDISSTATMDRTVEIKFRTLDAPDTLNLDWFQIAGTGTGVRVVLYAAALY